MTRFRTWDRTLPRKRWIPPSPLWFHLDASQLGLSDGASIATWPDLSANRLDVTATAGDEPTYRTPGQNGIGIAAFDAVDDNLTRTDPDLLDFGVESFTIFLLGQMGAQAVGQYLLRKKAGTTAATAGYSLRITAGNVPTFLVGNGTTQVSLTAPVNDAAHHLWSIVVDRAGNGVLYRDGVQVASASLAGVTGSIATVDNLFIGDASPNATTRVGEVRIYSGALATVTRQAIETTLIAKWGIPDKRAAGWLGVRGAAAGGTLAPSLQRPRRDLVMAGASYEPSAWTGGGWR